MLKSLAVTTLMLGSALALVQPQVAAARDRDDFRYGYRNGYERDAFARQEFRERERHEREEWREHERREHWRRRYDYRDYRNGYYDRYGYWHAYGGYRY